MGKFSFFHIFYGKKLYGRLFSVPVNCSFTLRREDGQHDTTNGGFRYLLSNRQSSRLNIGSSSLAISFLLVRDFAMMRTHSGPWVSSQVRIERWRVR